MEEQVIFGKHPVLDALEAGSPVIDKVLLEDGTRGELEVSLRKACKKAGVPMQYIPRERFAKYTKSNHQGVIALLGAVPNYYKLAELLPTILERGEVPLLVILDGVTDVRNFGAIARTAAGIGAHAIIEPLKGAASINGDAMKASAGALSTLPICRESSLSAVMDFLGEADIQVVASDLKTEYYVADIDFTEPTAIIMGAEGEGISRHLLQRSDRCFKIPMGGTIDSFNVSVATGMVLYEAARQRMNKAKME